jgi:hypothetical protein
MYMMKIFPVIALALFLFIQLSGCKTGVDIVISRHASPDEIKKVAIFKMERGGRYNQGERISDLLTHEFLKLGFDVVERSEIERLVKEQKFSVSGFIDPKEAVAIGKLSGADTIVIGSLQLDEKNKDILKYFMIKIISLKTGSVMITANLTKSMNINDSVSEISTALKKSLEERNKTVKN